MKHQYQYLFYIIFAALASHSVATAASKQIGGYLALNQAQYNGYYGNIHKYFDGLTDYHSGLGTGAGFGAEAKFYFTPKIFAYGGIGYRAMNFSLFATEPITLIYDEGPRPAQIDHTLDFNLSVFNMRAMFAYHLWQGLFVATGPSLDLYISQDFDYSMNLDSDDDKAIFKNTSSRELDTKTHEVPDPKQYELEWSFAAGYSFPVNKKKSLYVTPQVIYNLGLTNISDRFSSSLNVIEYSLGVAYQLKPAVLPGLNADVRLTYVNPNTRNDTSLVVERATTRKYFPLIHYIFFDEDSITIPARYQKITAEKAKYFYESDIKGTDALEVYYQILNILGRRMTGNSNTEITLSKVSTTAEELSDSSFIDRAALIKDYLVQVWDIEATRIDVVFDKAIVNKRDFPCEHIEILSDDKALFLPIEQEEIAYNLKSEALAFDIQIADTAFKKWNFSAQYGKDTISKLCGKTAASKQVQYPITGYSVMDFLYNKKMVSYQLKIDGGKKYKDMQLNNSTYLNVSIDENVTDVFYMLWLNQTNFTIADMVDFHWPTFRKILSGKYSYTVQAYTDVDLNTPTAERVAMRRIEKINELVEFNFQNIITTNEAFISKQLYDETYPEGMLYNRCIEIIINHSNTSGE